MSEKKKKGMFAGLALNARANMAKPNPPPTTPLPTYVPPRIGNPPVEYPPPRDDEPPAQHRMNMTLQKLTPRSQLMILLMLLGIVILGGLLLTIYAFSFDTHHPDLDAGVSLGRASEITVELIDELPITRTSANFYYKFQLSDTIQEWQYIPSPTTPIPFLNFTLDKIVSFGVCCQKHDAELDSEIYVCSNGYTYDVYSFEARLKSLHDRGLQCIVYLNSQHLSEATCSRSASDSLAESILFPS